MNVIMLLTMVMVMMVMMITIIMSFLYLFLSIYLSSIYLYIYVDPAYQIMNADYNSRFTGAHSNIHSNSNNINAGDGININNITSIISNVTSSLWSSIVGTTTTTTTTTTDNTRSTDGAVMHSGGVAIDCCHGIIIHLFIDSSQVLLI